MRPDAKVNVLVRDSDKTIVGIDASLVNMWRGLKSHGFPVPDEIREGLRATPEGVTFKMDKEDYTIKQIKMKGKDDKVTL